MDIMKVGKAITEARKSKGITQEELASKIGVSAQAVSKWENGHNLPDIENLMKIAELINVPYVSLLCVDKDEKLLSSLNVRGRIFQEENMYTRMKVVAQTENLSETFRALKYMRERHAGQYRKRSRFSSEDIQYINHPLIMACQAHAYGIRNDALLAAILLHDVVEDTGVTKEDLPFSDEVKNIVGLVSFSVPEGMTKREAKIQYYKMISNNPEACIVKIIDRCNNVSTMAASFTKAKIVSYIEETEEFVLPLTDVLKNNYPEYSDISFLVKYQIISVLETIKHLLLLDN